ncbi:hypothetical protein HYS97_03550 [Candidatus Daviesbacteria bacterium]|nr:hypothetical protein [Candidatus Daviesbacteria bacterium]
MRDREPKGDNFGFLGEDTVPAPYHRKRLRKEGYIDPTHRTWERALERYLPEWMVRFIEKPSTRINLEVVVALATGFIAGAIWQRRKAK